MNRPRVLLLETIAEPADAELRTFADVMLAESPADADCIASAHAAPFDAIMTRGKGRVTAALLDACPTVRVIARCGVGLDNVDVPAATARTIRVLNLPGCNANTIAEHTIMLMLAVGRGLVEIANAVRAGDWQSRDRYDRDEMHNKTVGIIGLGRIGTRVAEISAALGMSVIFADPSAPPHDHFERLPMTDLLTAADVVTLHCPLNRATANMIDADALARFRPGASLINTARGGLVDEPALIAALRSGRLAGFGADVLATEPLAADSPLMHLPNVVITPHSAGLTRTTYVESCLQSVRNVLAVLAGRDPQPPEAIFNRASLASIRQAS